MTDLTMKRPIDGLNTTIGTTRITSLDPGQVTSVAPYPGRDPDPALAALALRFPQPGAVHAAGAARLVWAGRKLAFLIGAPPPEGLADVAALSDQSDGWAWVHLTGPDAAAVLARLCPIDLRAAGFAPGTAARSHIGHMQALIVRTAPEGFEIAVFTSMAETLRHEVETAARAVAARNAL